MNGDQASSSDFPEGPGSDSVTRTWDRTPEPATEASPSPASPATDRSPAAATRVRKKRNSPPKFPPLLAGQVVAGRYEILEGLGRGGFGAVYRAHDRDLNRTVAIKQSNGLRSFVAGQIRNEAQSVASLNHPNIVAIHDLITVSENELLIVMECLEGTPLSKRLRHSRLPIADVVRVAIQISEALQHAHERLLVHSDLKPGNLFICENGLVKLLDFGLAVAYFPEELPGQVGGTPGYMSPEQIRAESHRIDGRVDVFSFGVVLYEMLTGAKPFVGANSRGIFEATLRKEVPPPRQLNAEIDEELQRIVLKCLEKRIIDRYDSAAALQADLKHWLQVNTQVSSDGLSQAVRIDEKAGNAPRSSLRMRAHGLRPYTELDADSYLSLVPGPRDRNGIPDSIVFWKRWVESDDPATDYPVGVLYGPSGSGKTSYVRAGLLHQLDPDICKVYVECRPGDLGERLTRIIQSRTHERSSGSSLRDLLTRLRSDESSSRGFRKLLIVLDQFESWSHTATVDERHDFADALRQCDGLQIRALVVTRDDYWMGVKELLRWLELPFQEGRNVASVDLLDPPQARRILEMMGREAGALPADGTALTSNQQQFIRQAVDELTVNGAVICVHLVMFMQMVRLQRWTPRGLRSGGGVAGACSLFFQELFQTSSNHSPEYRIVSAAVCAILSELLPPDNSTVATVSASKEQLAQAVLAAGCGHLFEDCLRVLSDDLRIVTPVADDPVADDPVADDPVADDPVADDLIEQESKTDGSGAPTGDASGDANYRLSHDFLVQPINVWLDRVRCRTWRGRTKSRLMQLSDAWARRPTKAHLPGFMEFLSLLVGSQFQSRSKPESQFLKAAARLHAGRMSVGVIALIAFMLMSVMAWRQWTVATEARQRELAAQVDLLFNGPASDVTTQIEKLQTFGADSARLIGVWTDSVDPQLRLRAQLYMQSLSPNSIAGIAPLIDEVPAELFDPILAVAEQASDAKSELTTIASTSSSTRANTRAAILLAYLGDSSALKRLMAGSESAERDQAILLEACTWRDQPQPWLELLTDDDPQVRYHAAVILGSYPNEVLQGANVNLDHAALINSPSAEVHSVGRFLAAHAGHDVASFPLQPPPNADWRLGPDNIPMVRIAPTEFEYEPVRNDSNAKRTLKIRRECWFATIPVSRRLFSEFAAATDTLPDGSSVPEVSVEGFDMPDELKQDDSQPILKMNLGQAYAFCNWLSQREGLQPCYRFEEVERKPLSTADYVPPEIPWKLIREADGFRVPTYDQYLYAIQALYTSGTAWKHVQSIGLSGGDYLPPEDDEHVRALFSLIPNRLGLFVNDPGCGTWIFGQRIYTAARLGPTSEIATSTRERPVIGYSIYLVQEEPVSKAE